jgi:hypothetical protein
LKLDLSLSFAALAVAAAAASRSPNMRSLRRRAPVAPRAPGRRSLAHLRFASLAAWGACAIHARFAARNVKFASRRLEIQSSLFLP